MQVQVEDKYDDEDWQKAEYLISRGFVKSVSDLSPYEAIRETAINIHRVKMRTYEEYIKNGGKPPFEGK
jgi:hypothetical protein